MPESICACLLQDPFSPLAEISVRCSSKLPASQDLQAFLGNVGVSMINCTASVGGSADAHSHDLLSACIVSPRSTGRFHSVVTYKHKVVERSILVIDVCGPSLAVSLDLVLSAKSAVRLLCNTP